MKPSREVMDEYQKKGVDLSWAESPRVTSTGAEERLSPQQDNVLQQLSAPVQPQAPMGADAMSVMPPAVGRAPVQPPSGYAPGAKTLAARQMESDAALKHRELEENVRQFDLTHELALMAFELEKELGRGELGVLEGRLDLGWAEHEEGKRQFDLSYDLSKQKARQSSGSGGSGGTDDPVETFRRSFEDEQEFSPVATPQQAFQKPLVTTADWTLWKLGLASKPGGTNPMTGR